MEEAPRHATSAAREMTTYTEGQQMTKRFDTKDPTARHKVDDMAETLEDLSVTVDEIKDDSEGIDEGKLDEIQGAIERATDAVDDIENEE